RAGVANAGRRGSIDDGAATLRDHDRDDVAAAQEHAFEIVVDLPVEILFRHFRHAARRRAADIVDQDVDAAEFFAACIGHLGDLRVIKHVAEMGGDLAVIADARDGLGHRLGCFVDSEDFGALAGEQHRGGAASAMDITARLFADRLSTRWGKPVVVENRPGGDGLVALNAFIGARDDHTLFFGPAAIFLVHLYDEEKPAYDPHDIAPISQVY